MTTRRHRRPRVQTASFELPVNGRSYAVAVTPYTVATGETLYRVSYGNGPVHIFGWDNGLNRFAEADNTAEVIPPVIEMAIAEKLQILQEELQQAA